MHDLYSGGGDKDPKASQRGINAAATCGTCRSSIELKYVEAKHVKDKARCILLSTLVISNHQTQPLVEMVAIHVYEENVKSKMRLKV